MIVILSKTAIIVIHVDDENNLCKDSHDGFARSYGDYHNDINLHRVDDEDMDGNNLRFKTALRVVRLIAIRTMMINPWTVY